MTRPLFNETLADDRWDDGQPSVLAGEVGIALQPGRVLGYPLVSDKVEYLWVDLNKETILNGYVLELKKTNEFNPQDVTNDSRYKDGELWKDSDGDGLLGITEWSLGQTHEPLILTVMVSVMVKSIIRLR